MVHRQQEEKKRKQEEYKKNKGADFPLAADFNDNRGKTDVPMGVQRPEFIQNKLQD